MKLSKWLQVMFSQKLVLSWIVSYLIVFLIPLVNNFYIYHRAEDALQQSLYNSDRQMLEASSRTFEKTLIMLSTIAAGVENNEHAKQLLNSNTNDPASRINEIELAKFLSEMEALDENIEDIYVYIQERDFCISTHNMNNSADFFRFFYGGSDITEEVWRSSLTHTSYATYLSAVNSTGTHYVDLLYSLPLYSEHMQACIVIRLDSQIFYANSGKYTDIQNKNLYVLDGNNNLILRQETNFNLDVSQFHISDGITIDQNGNLIVSQTSNVNNWKYVSITTRDVISGELTYIRTPILLTQLLCLLLVLLLICYFSYRNYRPIGTILHSAKNAIQGKFVDEYDMINNIMKDYLHDKQRLRHIENSEHLAKRVQLLNNLIKGNLKPYQSLENELAAYDISFISNYFSIMMIKIIDAEELFSEDDAYENTNNQEHASNILFIITNILEELLNEFHRGYVTEFEGWILCIANINANRLSSWYEDVNTATNKTNAFIQENFCFSFSASLSGIHEGISSLPNALYEAKKIMNYHALLKNDTLLMYDDMDFRVSSRYFTEKHEHKLLNFIRLGNEDIASGIVDDILDQIAETTNVDQIHILILQISSSILKCIFDDTDADETTDYSAFLQCMDTLINSRMHTAYQLQLHNLVHVACEIVKKRKVRSALDETSIRNTSKSANELVDDIKEYIRVHYTENTLNIASIGYRFSITPYYLSNIFKKAENTSLLDYIARQRIEASKQLLRESTLSLSDIAERVGFGNIRSFIRTFKKFEGITPGQYKEMQ